MNRIYKVVAGRNGGNPDVRLIRATSQAQAIRHCAAHLKAEPASADDVASLMAAGAKVEMASDKRDLLVEAEQAVLRG